MTVRSAADLLPVLIEAARLGGAIALPFFQKGKTASAAVSYKQEGSPVTEADIAVDRFLEQRLKSALPGYGWLSEESVDDATRLSCNRVIIVDPIDGTRGFVAGDDTWCVSIGVTENGRPLAGVLFAPARNELFAAARGHGATLNGLPLPRPAARSSSAFVHAGPLAVAQRANRTGNPQIQSYRSIPSLAYRLVLLTLGEIDAAAASKACHDWDIAAADLILSEAGFQLRDLDGTLPVYNNPMPVHPALVASRLEGENQQ